MNNNTTIEICAVSEFYFPGHFENILYTCLFNICLRTCLKSLLGHYLFLCCSHDKLVLSIVSQVC